MKGCVPGLALIKRLRSTRKWAIHLARVCLSKPRTLSAFRKTLYIQLIATSAEVLEVAKQHDVSSFRHAGVTVFCKLITKTWF